MLLLYIFSGRSTASGSSGGLTQDDMDSAIKIWFIVSLVSFTSDFDRSV